MSGSAENLPELTGGTVLIAESNPLIALDLAETVVAWGAQPLLYNDLSAQQQADVPGKVCAALVDLSQFHQHQARLIDALREHNVPTVLTTAWQLDIIGRQFPGMTIFEKPVNYQALANWFADSSECLPSRRSSSG